MPRPIGKLAPGWWDYTTFDAALLEDAAKLTVRAMERLSRPGSKVVMYDTAGDFYLAEAAEYIDAWRELNEEASMAGQYRFSFGPWNIHEGADPFGPPVRPSIEFVQKLKKYKELGFDCVEFPVLENSGVAVPARRSPRRQQKSHEIAPNLALRRPTRPVCRRARPSKRRRALSRGMVH